MNIFDASSTGDIHRIRQLLESGENIQSKDEYGNTPLMYALRNHKHESAIFLVDNGANLNDKNNSNTTILMLASLFNNIEIVKKIMNLDVDLNEQDNNGYTALMYACHDDKIKIAQLLVDHHADINIVRKFKNYEMTCFDLAKGDEQYKILNMLDNVM